MYLTINKWIKIKKKLSDSIDQACKYIGLRAPQDGLIYNSEILERHLSRPRWLGSVDVSLSLLLEPKKALIKARGEKFSEPK